MNETTVKSKLSRKDVFWSYVYWMMFALSCQNMERMEAPAFAGVMGKMADKLYNKIEDKQVVSVVITSIPIRKSALKLEIPGPTNSITLLFT